MLLSFASGITTFFGFASCHSISTPYGSLRVPSNSPTR
jgi:hypothetical protein